MKELFSSKVEVKDKLNYYKRWVETILTDMNFL
jgi:hypothetical protein